MKHLAALFIMFALYTPALWWINWMQGVHGLTGIREIISTIILFFLMIMPLVAIYYIERESKK